MHERADFGTNSVQVHSYTPLLINFRNFGERGYAARLEEMLKKASEIEHMAKKVKTMRRVSWKETLV